MLKQRHIRLCSTCKYSTPRGRCKVDISIWSTHRDSLPHCGTMQALGKSSQMPAARLAQRPTLKKLNRTRPLGTCKSNYDIDDLWSLILHRRRKTSTSTGIATQVTQMGILCIHQVSDIVVDPMSIRAQYSRQPIDVSADAASFRALFIALIAHLFNNGPQL